MPSRKADLDEIGKKHRTPHAAPQPRKDPAVQQASYYAKDKRLPPSKQSGYEPPRGKSLRKSTPPE